MSTQFHFRNFTNREMWVGVYHMGCGGVPWQDGRPKCWEATIPHNPTGGSNSVYVPSDWVVDFTQWFELIVDGLKLIEDAAIYISSEGQNETALLHVLADIFNVTEDTIKAEAATKGVDLSSMAQDSLKAFEQTCANMDVAAERVIEIGNQLGLGSNWMFIGGSSYDKNIRQNTSKFVDGQGWSVFEAETTSASVDRIANHAFINNGHVIQVIDDIVIDKFWKSAW